MRPSGSQALGTRTIHELTQFDSTLKRITQQNFSEKYQTTQPQNATKQYFHSYSAGYDFGFHTISLKGRRVRTRALAMRTMVILVTVWRIYG